MVWIGAGLHHRINVALIGQVSTCPEQKKEIKMKMISKQENEDGKTIIETESKFLFFTKIRKFIAVERHAGDYSTWLELPNYSPVSLVLSFQLDTWEKYNKS
jgi:hypothetical protein